jgi:hypothetical protein
VVARTPAVWRGRRETDRRPRGRRRATGRRYGRTARRRPGSRAGSGGRAGIYPRPGERAGRVQAGGTNHGTRPKRAGSFLRDATGRPCPRASAYLPLTASSADIRRAPG